MELFRTPKLTQVYCLILVALASILVVAGVHAQSPSTPTEASAPTTTVRTVTLDAPSLPVTRVLAILADQGNLNIITGPGVAGQSVTVHIKDTPVDQAVNMVVRAAGLSYEQIGNSILVADRNALKEETGLGTYVIPLKYISASEMRIMIHDMTDQVQVDSGGNSLIIKTSPRTIADIQGVVGQVDRPVAQIEVEARIVEVSTDDLTQLGINWSNINSWTTVIAQGIPEPSPADQVPANLGYHFLGDQPHTSMQNKAFPLTLDAILDRGNGKLLANPRLITTNGHEASMLVGQVIPYVVPAVIQGVGGVTTSQTIQKEEVGIKLHVTPKVNADGYITTTVTPELSSVLRFTGPDNTLPIVSRRVATTTVRLRDGQSVIIGGLLNEETAKSVTKLPLLGDIPGIGLLFQHVRETKHKTDLVIEVTPHLVRSR